MNDYGQLRSRHPLLPCPRLVRDAGDRGARELLCPVGNPDRPVRRAGQGGRRGLPAGHSGRGRL